MKLDLIYYCQDRGLPSEWDLEGCQLGNINLIVGKNASGKTKTLEAIVIIAGFLSGELDIKPERSIREWKLIFDSDDEVLVSRTNKYSRLTENRLQNLWC